MASAGAGVGAPPQDSVIDEEYKVWRKNSPFLYDVLLTHALEWPSLTVQWLPDHNTVHGGDYVEHKLLLGTHVGPGSSDRNYLMVAKVRLPSEEVELKLTVFDEEKGELGGYGGSLAKVEVDVRINHPTEVNRARHCPGNPFFIATKTASSDVLVFDYSKHPQKPVDDAVTPLLRLTGHEKEGYGLAWSPVERSMLLSGADDGLVCLWDCAAAKGTGAGVGAGAGAGSKAVGGTPTAPLLQLLAHSGAVVEDVAWNAFHEKLFGSVSDDMCLALWDARATATGPTASVKAHEGHAMALSFHPAKEFLIATGGADKHVRIWDARSIKKPIHTLEGDDGDVLGVQWSPFSDAHIASSSSDRRITVWDIARIGTELAPEDQDGGAPEKLFVHGGHTDRVADFSWNPTSQWIFASVAEDNVLHVWKIADDILNEEDGVGADADDDEGADEGPSQSKRPRTTDNADDVE